MADTSTNELAFEAVVRVVANAYRSGATDRSEGDTLDDDEQLRTWAAERLEAANIHPAVAVGAPSGGDTP